MKLYTERVQHIEDLCQRATADADEVLKCVAGDVDSDAAGQGLESSSHSPSLASAHPTPR